MRARLVNLYNIIDALYYDVYTQNKWMKKKTTEFINKT